MRVRSVKYNAMMNAILATSSFIFPLVTVPYVSRVLSVQGNGHIAFAQYVVQLFSYVAVLGIPTYGIRECAKIRENKVLLARTTKELLVILGASTSICYILYIVSVLTIPKLSSDKPLFLVFSFNLVLATFGIEWFYQALEQYTYITVRNLIFKVLAIALMFLFVKNENDTLKYAMILVFASSGSNLINIFRMMHLIDLRKSNTGKINIVRHLKPVMVFFAANFAKNFYLTADIVLLGFFSNTFQVGLYQFVVKIKGVLVSGISSVGNVMIPRLSYFISKNMRKEFIDLIKKNLNFLCFVGLSLSAYIWIFAKNIVIIVAGPSFVDAIMPLRIIGIVVFLTCINIVTGVQILVPLGREKIMAIFCVIGAAISTIFNVFFDRSLGALAPSLAILLTEGTIFIAQIFFCLDILKDSFDYRNFAKIVFSLFISCIAIYAYNYFLILSNYFLQFVIGSLLFWFLLLSTALLIHESTSMIGLRLIKKRTRY